MPLKLPSIPRIMGMPHASSPEWKSPLVFLMGFLFLGFGLGSTLTLPYRMYQKNRLDKGVAIPAKLLKVEKISSKSISVQYEFRWNNRMIKGDRVSIFSRSDDVYHRLTKALENDSPVTCFVDPHDTSFSALEKDVNVLDFFILLVSLPLAAAGSIYLKRFFSTDNIHSCVKKTTSRRHVIPK